MNARLSSAAESEIAESVRYYFEESLYAPSAFLDEIDEATILIERQPTLYPIYFKDVRVKHLDRFPFSIFYSIGQEDIYILSVAHNSRKPDFWKNRI